MIAMSKIKVSIVKVENDDVQSAVKRAIELLGGLEQFIEHTNDVLLKPNLLSAPKDEAVKAKIRTDPRVVETLADMVVKLDKNVLIGDSSGAGQSGGTRVAIKRSGYLEIGEKSEKIQVRSLEQHGPIKAEINGKKLKKANISKEFLESKAVINIPKMKTHGLALYTGAIKNLYGTICGADKTRIHSLGATFTGFAQCLVDLYAYEKTRIKLNVMDAIIALEGMGPGARGDPVEMNLILASEDAVALDSVAFRIMGSNPKTVPTIRFAAEQGLGVMNLEDIEIVGEKIEDHKRKFKLPKVAFLGRIPFAKFSNIIFEVPKYIEGCTGCRNCERACPEKVITITKNKIGQFIPKIDYNRCISCFTCIEICPEACYKTKNKNTVKIVLSILATIVVAGIIALLVLLL